MLPSESEVREISEMLVGVVDMLVEKKLAAMGLPNMCDFGVIKTASQIPANSGKWYADVYINADPASITNGTATAYTNIPVNPTIGPSLTAGTPVLVLRINFERLDRFVAFVKPA